MKICIISDTHNKHKRLSTLPEADMIIHCGDFTSVGKEHEIRDFMKWYTNLEQYKYKLIIAGNHDWLFERSGMHARSLVPKNIVYLQDSGVEIEGLYFYGSPVQLPFYDWAFNREESRLAQHWAAIPDKTDVLITHCPPYMIMDYVPYSMQHEGSPSLYREVTQRIKPLVHAMGHIHNGYGIKIIEGTTFINASNLDEEYMCVNKPILIEIIDRKVVIIN
jgi:Icc-related predicted phosphoesterase